MDGFDHRATRFMARRGIGQFLDIGSGIPLAQVVRG
jgi:S-adenosyl methyltransferase